MKDETIAVTAGSGLSRLWFGSQPLSFERINSIAIFAATKIPVQMKFLARARSTRSGRTRRQARICDLQQLLPEFRNHERHHDGCDSSWPRTI